jgi:hypothetical protein
LDQNVIIKCVDGSSAILLDGRTHEDWNEDSFLFDSDGRLAWNILINGYCASFGGIDGQTAVQIDPRVEFREKLSNSNE